MIDEPTLFDAAPTLTRGTAWTRNGATRPERAAAEATARTSRGTKWAALRLYARAGDVGLTDDEVAAGLDHAAPRADGEKHNPSKIASRRKELEENRFPDGTHGPALVEKTDVERRTRRGIPAAVYRITAAGRLVLEVQGAAA